MAKENRVVTLEEKHQEAINKLKEKPSGFNFSQYVRKSLEDDYPELFD